MNTRFTSLVLVASMLLVACRHAEVARQPGDKEVHNHFLGTPTTSETAADSEILQHIVGAWTTADDPMWASYPVLKIRPNGSFAIVNTSRAKPICEGTWFVERGFLLLVKSNAAPFEYYGFHKVRHVDDHHLVCGPGMSVAGELKFIR